MFATNDPVPRLRDDQIAAIRSALPAMLSKRQGSDESLRRFVEGGLLVMLHGRHWAALPPERYGNWRNNRVRHVRWLERGVWVLVAAALGMSEDDQAKVLAYERQHSQRRHRIAERRRRSRLSDLWRYG